MGKALDLPDPLESAAAATQPLGNADDLLAQLAGEEVDRLLAEADAEGARPSSQSKAGDAGPAELPPPPEPPIQEQLDALFSAITPEHPLPDAPAAPASPAPAPPAATSVAPTPAPPAPSAPAVAPIQPAPFSPVTSKLPDDIDANEVMAAILGDANTSTPAVPIAPPAVAPIEPPPMVTATAAPPAPAAAPAAVAIVPAKPAELETSAAERQGLSIRDPADELPTPGELALLSAPVEDDRPLPVYLKPLEWMNAPLDVMPTPVRDVIGQIAILTLVNAIAVLIYVFVFRKGG